MLPIDHPRFRPVMELIDDGHIREAIEKLDATFDRMSPNDRVVALYWKIVCLLRLGDDTQARTCLEEALNQPDIRHSLRICLELQGAYLAEKDGLEKGVVEVQSVLNRYAKQFSTPDFFWQRTDAKSYLGKRLSRLGRYPEAIKELEAALSFEVRPAARYRLHNWTSSAYYQSGDLRTAKEHLKCALIEADSASKAQLPADHPAQICYELALIAYREGRLRDAEEELARASAVAEKPELVRVITKLKSLLHNAQPA